MTTKESVLKEIEIRNKAHESDINIVKQQYNSTIMEEVESNNNDIETNYNMGLITIHDSLEMKIKNLQYAHKECFNLNQ